MPVVVLTGTLRERGRQHGEALREQIASYIDAWKEELHADYQVHPDEYIRDFLASVDFDQTIQRWTPGVLDEVAGIAEGANQDIETMRAIQFGDEEWWYGYYRKRSPEATPREKCSTLGVVTESGTYVGQTMDLPRAVEGHQALLHHQPSTEEAEAYIFTIAGLVALDGVNRHGVGICCNTLMQLNPNPKGLPVAMVVRGVLRQRDFDAAADFVESVSHASGQNYVIGGPGQVASFECSGDSVARFSPLADGRRVYHTNHPLVNQDQARYQSVQQLGEANVVGGSTNSESRLEVLARWLADGERPIEFSDLKSVLGSREHPEHPICRQLSDGEGKGFTAGTLLYELEAMPPRLHLAAGPLSEAAFQLFEFR
jgi:hypothetical protein